MTSGQRRPDEDMLRERERNEYCNCNGLRVNIRKTKMMVFARSETRFRNLPTFKFGNLYLDLVDDYVYLGICFNWNG